MLLSRHIKLVGAFDHRHVFLDPDPDPDQSFEERARLFALPGSSWPTTTSSSISPGGGVFLCTAKSIPLSPEVRSALAVEATTPRSTSSSAPCSGHRSTCLEWGHRHVKARQEAHADVGDRASDAIRVDAEELVPRRWRRWNLGLTQRASHRVRVLGGRRPDGRIDNSAGVDWPDHEVNIKILLDAIVAEGDLTEKQRNAPPPR